MSASSEKRRRQAEREQGIDKRQVAQREADEKAKKSKKNWTIGTVLIVLLLVAVFVLNSSLPYRLPAAKIGHETYSAGQMNYFYTTSLNSMYSYLSMFGVDMNTDLDDQECALLEDGSWEDYFQQQAVTSATYVQALYEEALANGFTLSEEGQASVDSTMESLGEYAEAYGFSSPQKYLKAVYGPGVTEDIVRDILTKGTLGGEYAASVQEGFTYSDTELADYYNEHVADYQTYDYLYYYIAAETEETTNEAGETVTNVVEGGLEAAEEAANTIAASVTDEESFDAAVTAYAEEATVSNGSAVIEANIPEAFAAWVADDARVAGDVTVATNDSGAYVVMYQGMEDNLYNEVSVRHILIKAVDENGDGAYGEEEMAAAKTKIEEIEAEWNAGQKTEEAFAALAEEYSEDAGSNTNGGLYENIYKGQMVSEFNDFCFAEGRQPGDTGIASYNGANYAGYHLIYFVGEDGLHSLSLAKNSMLTADYTEWENGVIEKYTAETKMGLGIVG